MERLWKHRKGNVTVKNTERMWQKKTDEAFPQSFASVSMDTYTAPLLSANDDFDVEQTQTHLRKEKKEKKGKLKGSTPEWKVTLFLIGEGIWMRHTGASHKGPVSSNKQRQSTLLNVFPNTKQVWFHSDVWVTQLLAEKLLRADTSSKIRDFELQIDSSTSRRISGDVLFEIHSIMNQSVVILFNMWLCLKKSFPIWQCGHAGCSVQ